MDLSKAKNILIVVFLSLNIFLLIYISAYRMGQDVSRETISNTRRILDSRGVVLECEIPLRTGSMPRLMYGGGNFDRLRIAEKLLGSAEASQGDISSGKEFVKDGRKLVFQNDHCFVFKDEAPSGGITASDKDGTEKRLREFLLDLGIPVSTFKLDHYARSDDESVTYILTDSYRNMLVFDNRVRVNITKNGISYMECSYREVKGFSQDRIKNIMPAYQVLLKNFSHGENIAITGIAVGFKGYEQQQGMVEYSEGPAWRISVKDGEPRYFKASDGEEIR